MSTTTVANPFFANCTSLAGKKFEMLPKLLHELSSLNSRALLANYCHVSSVWASFIRKTIHTQEYLSSWVHEIELSYFSVFFRLYVYRIVTNFRHRLSYSLRTADFLLITYRVRHAYQEISILTYFSLTSFFHYILAKYHLAFPCRISPVVFLITTLIPILGCSSYQSRQ